MKEDIKMKIHSLDEILKDNSQQPEALIGEGILLPKNLLMITGAKKVRKTFLAFNLGIALACGESFAGFKINESCKVLIFSAEGGYFPNRERIQIMCKSINLEASKNLYVCFDTRLKLENDIDYIKLEDKIKEFSPKVLIIDPFVKFHGLEENSAKDMNNILERLRHLIEDYEVSIILIHHQGKEQSKGARGSSAILGEYDSCITLSKEGSENNHVNKIEFDLRHSISPKARKIIFDAKTFWFEEDILPIVKLLQTYGSMDKKTLVDHCTTKGIYTKTAAYRAIDRLVERGKIHLSGSGLFHI